jgi:hypothetical protein
MLQSDTIGDLTTEMARATTPLPPTTGRNGASELYSIIVWRYRELLS